MCYDTFGDSRCPPLVLVMGLAAQMIVWDEDFCRRLAAGGFWVIRFDNRDIGLSTKFAGSPAPSMAEVLLRQVTRKPLETPYSLLDMAQDTVGLMDALGIDSAHVVGVSMGGAIAQELAIHFPRRLRTLTSIMSSTGDPRLPGPEPRALAVLTKKPPQDRAEHLSRYLETWSTLAGDYFPFDAERTLRLGEAVYERGLNPAGVSRQMLAIIASGNRTAALTGVSVPSLVIHGALDTLVPVEAGRATAKAIPGAELAIVEGMGHTLPRQAWPHITAAIFAHANAAEARAAQV